MISVCLYFAATSSTQAQERSGFSTDENLKGQDELSPHMDSHVNSAPTTISNNSSNSINREKENYRDSVAVKPVGAVRNKLDSSSEKKEEETLSFNILYFIIQKFKVSDMMN